MLVEAADSATNPRVLVLLACRNGRDWISTQLRSILQQTAVEVELLVRDDCSIDGTLALVHTFASANPGRLIAYAADVPSGSAGANFRALIALADVDGFDYVALADQDDVWKSEKLSRAIAALAQTGAMGYSGAVEAFWENGRRTLLMQSPNAKQCDFLFEGAGQGCTFVMPASAFSRVQTFCRSHAEMTSTFHYHDWLIYLLVRSWGGKWYFDPVAYIEYRQHRNNEIGARGGAHAFLRRLKLVRQGWYHRQVATALDLCIAAGGQNSLIFELQEVFSAPRSSFRRRAKLAWFSFLHARRRLKDRVAASVFAWAGWI